MPQFIRSRLVRQIRAAADAVAEAEMLEFMYEPEQQEAKKIYAELDHLAARAEALVKTLNEQAEKRGSEVTKPAPMNKTSFSWHSHEQRAKAKKSRDKVVQLEEKLVELRRELQELEG